MENRDFYSWEQRKLGEVAEKFFGGGTPSTSNEKYWGGTLPWIQSSDIIEGNLFDVKIHKHITEKGLRESSTKLVPANSIAIVTRVGVGKLSVIPFPYSTSQDFLSLSSLTIDIVFGSYLLYLAMQLQVKELQGTSIKGITKEEVLKILFFLPSCKEQQLIGSFLKNIDHLITLHQRKPRVLK